jgi:precorrin-2 dehydrogenase/sirohydrochlorin ferrochelatase
MPFTYPLMLDVSSRPIVIIGGGNVATRKAKTLLDCGAAQIRVVAPDVSADMPQGVQLIRENYQPYHLDHASLVFAATDSSEVNDQIVADARARNLLVCRADVAEDSAGDFSTPALLRKGHVTVTVSAGSPALSALIRDQLANVWDRRWSAMAQAMESLRPQILASSLRPDERTQVFRELATQEALEILESCGLAGLKTWLTTRHPQLSPPLNPGS